MGSVIGFVVLLGVVLVVCVIGALAVQWIGERMGRREPEPPAAGIPRVSPPSNGHGSIDGRLRQATAPVADDEPNETHDRAISGT